jgi:RPA family protein
MIRPFSFATLAALGLSLSMGPFSGTAEEKESGKPRVWEKKDREKIQAWESLSPEQREKLREALRGVWTDPAVINAREEVKHATEAYQAAIKAAVERADPTVADLLSKVQGSGMMALPPDGPNGPGSPGSPSGLLNRGFDQQIRPPGFLDGLSPEAREKFRKTEEEAMSSAVVKAARSELDRIRGEDEALRRERVEAHRKLRKVTVEEMIRIDPSIAAMQKRLLDGGRPPGNGEKKKEPVPKEQKSSDPEPKPESGKEGEGDKTKG